MPQILIEKYIQNGTITKDPPYIIKIFTFLEVRMQFKSKIFFF